MKWWITLISRVWLNIRQFSLVRLRLEHLDIHIHESDRTSRNSHKSSLTPFGFPSAIASGLAAIDYDAECVSVGFAQSSALEMWLRVRNTVIKRSEAPRITHSEAKTPTVMRSSLETTARRTGKVPPSVVTFGTAIYFTVLEEKSLAQA